MKISKHIHSCLLIEEDTKKILVDPGIFTFESKALDINSLNKLDYVLITHEHPDHMHIPFIKEIKNKFPEVQFISNNYVAKLLKEEGIEVNTESNNELKIKEVPHEKVFGTEPPKNVLFNIFGKLTHPGDSLHFSLETPVLALPIQAPWASLTEAVNKGFELKPKVIIPIHDWHWNDDARNTFYKRLIDYFGQKGIEFKGLQTGEVLEV